MKNTTNNKLKNPTTYREQVKLLKSRNLTISNEEKAIRILERVNYYRLSTYMIIYKTGAKFSEVPCYCYLNICRISSNCSFSSGISSITVIQTFPMFNV